MSKTLSGGPEMRITFHGAAGEHEHYAPHAFDRLIGQEAPFKINDTRRGTATVVAVVVDEDGSGATWTVDIEAPDLPGLAAHPIPGLLAGFTGDQGISFAVPEIPERWWE